MIQVYNSLKSDFDCKLRSISIFPVFCLGWNVESVWMSIGWLFIHFQFQVDRKK